MVLMPAKDLWGIKEIVIYNAAKVQKIGKIAHELSKTPKTKRLGTSGY